MGTKIIVEKYLSPGARDGRIPKVNEMGTSRRSYSVLIGVEGFESRALELADYTARVLDGSFSLEESTTPVNRCESSIRKKGRTYYNLGVYGYEEEDKMDDDMTKLANVFAEKIRNSTGLDIKEWEFEVHSSIM